MQEYGDIRSIILEVDTDIEPYRKELSELIKKLSGHAGSIGLGADNDSTKKGVVLVIPTNIASSLQKLSSNHKLVLALNNKEFLDSILAYAFVGFSEGPNLIQMNVPVIFDSETLIESILDALRRELPKNAIVWVGIPINVEMNSRVGLYARLGFANPYIAEAVTCYL